MFRVMKFGRYVTVDDGGNYVTVHELNVRRIIRHNESLGRLSSTNSWNKLILKRGYTICKIVLFFFSFVGDQTQTSARPVLGRDCTVYSPRAFETLKQEKVTLVFFFVVCKKDFLLVLSKCSIRSKTMCQNVQGLRHL